MSDEAHTLVGRNRLCVLHCYAATSETHMRATNHQWGAEIRMNALAAHGHAARRCEANPRPNERAIRAPFRITSQRMAVALLGRRRATQNKTSRPRRKQTLDGAFALGCDTDFPHRCPTLAPESECATRMFTQSARRETPRSSISARAIELRWRLSPPWTDTRKLLHVHAVEKDSGEGGDAPTGCLKAGGV